MSKQDCLDADWYRVGFDVALEGEIDKVGAFTKRADVCSKHGVVADLTDYEAGYVDGLFEFCQLDNGVKMGVRGKATALTLCPEDDNPGYLAAYDAGYRLFVLRREETRARTELDRVQNAESRIYQQIRSAQRSVSEGASEQQIENAQRRIRYLRRNAYNLQYDADALRQRYYRAKEAADAYAEFLELEYEGI